jgi:hypothetical protein
MKQSNDLSFRILIKTQFCSISRNYYVWWGNKFYQSNISRDDLVRKVIAASK